MKIPENCPADVVSTARRFLNGTTKLGRLRIHEWSEDAIWISHPGGPYWSGIGMRDYGKARHYVIPRDIAKVGMLRGELGEWAGRAPRAEIQALLNG